MDVEGLRGVAVLAVVCYHAGIPGWGGGFVGVDVFFVISGYLITGLLVAEVERAGRVDFLRFFARRVRRLLPAAFVVLAATVLAAAALLSPGEQLTVARTARATGAYLANVFFLLNASDYFAAANDTNPLLHMWSLAVEEQFYLVWPLLVVGLLRGPHPRRRLARLAVVASVVTFAACVVFTRRNQPWAFFGTPFRVWEFGAGALAVLVPADVATGRRVRSVAVAVGASAIAAAVVLFTRATPFPGSAALLPVAGAAVLLWAGAPPAGGAASWLLDRSLLTALGRLSYSWYLWHWPVLVFGAVLWPTPSVAVRAALAAASLGLAAITYVTVEQPIRLSRRLNVQPWPTVGLAAASTALWFVGATTLRAVAIRDSESPTQRAVLAAVRIPEVYDAHCVSETGDDSLHRCIYGDPAGRATVVLFGDSHAAQWSPALDVVARRRGWRVVTLLKSSCPAAKLDVRTREGSAFPDCPTWRARALAEIKRARPNLVILASSRTYVGSVERKPSAFPSPITAADWSLGYRATLAQLSEGGSAVALLQDTPTPGIDIPVCLARAGGSTATGVRRCSIMRSRAVPLEVRTAERSAAAGLGNIATIDLTDEVCSTTVCPPVRDGVVVYRDADHLTVGIVEKLAGVLDLRLASASSAWRRGRPPVGMSGAEPRT